MIAVITAAHQQEWKQRLLMAHNNAALITLTDHVSFLIILDGKRVWRDTRRGETVTIDSSVLHCVVSRTTLSSPLLFLFVAGPATYWTAVSARCQPYHNALLVEGVATGETHQYLLAHKGLQTNHTFWTLKHVTGPHWPITVLMVRNTVRYDAVILHRPVRWQRASIPGWYNSTRTLTAAAGIHVAARRKLWVEVHTTQWSLVAAATMWRFLPLFVWMLTTCFFIRLFTRGLQPGLTNCSEPPGWQCFDVIHVY